jgi:O-antigen/teichoic acid export membrane protein
LLIAPITYGYGYVGLVASYLVATTLTASAVFLLLGFPGRIALDHFVRDVRRFVAVGVPIQLAITGSWFLYTADRLGILVAGGPTTLGLWTLATLCSSVIWAFPPAIDQVLFAAFHESLAATKGRESLATLADRGMMMAGLVVAVSVVILQFLLSPVVNLLLPAFAEGIEPARIYIMGSAVAIMVAIPARVLQALGRSMHFTLIVITGSALMLLLTAITLRTGGSLSVVAAVVSGVHLGVLFAVLRIYFVALGSEFRDAIRSSVRWALAPSAALALSTIAIVLGGPK